MADAVDALAGDEAAASSRTEITARVALAVLAATAVAGIVVPGSRAGLGLMVASMVVLAAATLDANVRASRWRVALLVAATALLAVPLLRDATWLVTVDLLMALVLTAAALGGATSLASYARTSLATVVFLPGGPAAVVRSALQRAPQASPGSLAAAARAGALTVGLVGIFAGLFVWADGAFAQLFRTASPDLAALDLPVRAGVALMALAAGGALAMLAREPVKAVERPDTRPVLSPLEWGAALGALTVLFAGFVGVQLVVLFGGHDHVLRTAGLTYAEYAREGFVQLLVASLLVIAVLAGARYFARTETPRQKLVLKVLLTLLAALTLVILASAISRLDLYADAFGATRIRLAAGITCAWIGCVLVAMTAGLFTPHRRWLPPVLALLTAAIAVAVNFSNPDALVAERNVDRYEQIGRIDIDYNRRLSADATPELLALPADLRERVLATQRNRLAEPDGFWGYNIAREQARRALED